jgi:type I restriction enzyme R subunit
VLTYQAGYAQHLRDALPQATFVAFTGTPVSGSDKNTEAVFGEHIHIYDMQQAKEDGATVPIYYESRLAKLKLNEELLPLLDDEVDELTEDEEEEQQAQAKSKWTALEQVVGTQSRIDSVAQDWWSTLRRAMRQPRQGYGGRHEPRYLRASVRRNHQAASRLAQR